MNPRSTSVAAQGGYCAPYLHLLDENVDTKAVKRLSATKRRIKQIHQALDIGMGQGRGDDYQPWMKIRKNFTSPVSYQVFDSVAIKLGNHHFLSKLEFDTALLCAFLGADELRECLPMWPFEHPNPRSGISSDLDHLLDSAPSLLDIARNAGIDHGFYIGTNIPYVGSLDLMFCRMTGNSQTLFGISCKPKAVADISERARERIELDRLYCRAVNAHHVHEDAAALDPQVLCELMWLRPLTSEVRTHKGSNQLNDFCSIFNEFAETRSIYHSTAGAARPTGLSVQQAQRFFRLGVWLHQIDIDLTRQILMTKMINRGGAKHLAAWRAHYWGCTNA